MRWTCSLHYSSSLTGETAQRSLGCPDVMRFEYSVSLWKVLDFAHRLTIPQDTSCLCDPKATNRVSKIAERLGRSCKEFGSFKNIVNEQMRKEVQLCSIYMLCNGLVFSVFLSSDEIFGKPRTQVTSARMVTKHDFDTSAVLEVCLQVCTAYTKTHFNCSSLRLLAPFSVCEPQKSRTMKHSKAHAVPTMMGPT